MRNRAKCKLCRDVIESFHQTDLIYCSCKQIAIWGGNTSYKTYAEDYANFLRVDDDDKEIEVRVEGSVEPAKPIEETDPVKELDHLIHITENLPEHAKQAPTTQYDFLSMLYILKAYLKKS